MTAHSYHAEGGKVYCATDGETGTACTANGRDLEAFDRALALARRQREAIPRCPGCGVMVVSLDVEHLNSCEYQGRGALPGPGS